MRIDAPAAASPSARLPLVDAARGAALAAMVVYHFSWDLRYFGFITADVAQDLGWRVFARSIAGSFIFIVGVSLVLATRRGLNVRAFLKRLAIVAGAAAAITLVTFFVFPDAFIFFGILHHIAVASVIGLAFVYAPPVLTAVAAALSFALPALLAGPAFDHPALVWLGLSTWEPRSNDFVPVFPWLGVTLAGIAAARVWLLHAAGAKAEEAPAHPPAVAGEKGRGRDAAVLRARVETILAWAGRRSLPIYLIHQPVLFGLVYVAAQMSPPSLLGFEPAFVESCTRACVESEADPDLCRRTCQCLAGRSQEAGLWRDLMLESLSDEQRARYFDLADMCRIPDDGE